MKKKVMGLLLAGTMIMGVAAPVHADDVETVTMLTYVDWYGEGLKAVENYINENSSELGFKLEVQQIAGGSQGDELVAARTATNDLPDLLNTYTVSQYFSTYGGEGKLLPLEDLECISDYDQDVISSKSYTEDETLYGLPFGTAYYSGMYYNKKVLEAAGVEKYPTTWDEFLEACAKIKETGITPVYFSCGDAWTASYYGAVGFHGDYDEREMTSEDFWDAINTNQIKFKDCKYVWDALEKSKELIEQGYVQDTYLSDTYDMAQTALANGECAFYACANTVVSEIASKYPDKVEDIGGNVIPLFDEDHNYLDVSFPTVLSVTSAAKNPELAKKALDFMCSKEGMQIYADAQPGIYMTKGLETDAAPAFVEQSEYTPVSVWNYKYDITPYVHFIDYYVGAIDLEELPSEFDDLYERSAVANGDENWTE